jgi:phospholipase/carboxylesterase
MQVSAGDVDIRVREPDGEPEGALILNHGRGADENDLYPLLDELDPDRRLLAVTTGAPLRGVPPGGRHWYVVERIGYPHRETFAHSFGILAAKLDALLAEHGVDHGRTIYGGFSQGTVMSWALALDRGRPAPAGVIALSGFIPVVEGFDPDLASRGDMRAYIHHGANDPVIAAGFGRDAAGRLREAGIDVTYEETDAGHWLPPEIVPRVRDFVADVLPAPAASGPFG